ncbi:hypothetical protein WHR41_06627 [Cladosporium halotolerans]|uniref:Integral membrane protein n=1 Tax=Cladosporium halotolerans TaxID=1052096 RepID=A0AB34KMM4_9PEZI
MIWTPFAAVLVSLLSASIASAQLLAQGLPACAQSCTLLNQAAQACGGTASANQAIWACFCQSAYLSTLYSTPNGICDAFCTDPSQNQQVMTWYQGNCGTDNGASEHADNGSGGQTTVTMTSTSTSSSSSSTSNAAAAGATATGSSSTDSQGFDREPQEGGWWHNHWKWVVMLIVLAIALSLIAILGTWLKKRHDRKRDQINTSFNEGITTRSAPQNPGEKSETLAPPAAPAFTSKSAGRNSPARTREAFMPYGYNYTRSDPRLASGSDDAIEQVPPPVIGAGPLASGRSSPLARGGTPVGELEKGVGEETPTTSGQTKRKKVLVRERSVEDSTDTSSSVKK